MTLFRASAALTFCPMLLLIVTVPVVVEAQQQEPQCTQDSESIPSCTRAIASGRLSGKQLAEAHFNRGFGYWLDEKYRDAIQDYDKAVELVPDNADYYWWRGCAYKASGNRRAADADFERGRKLGYEVIEKDAPCGL